MKVSSLSTMITLAVFAGVGVQTAQAEPATLGNNAPVENLAADTGEDLEFFIHVHGDGAKNLRIATTGDNGDADIYVKHGSAPTPSSGDHDCVGFSSDSNEECVIDAPKHGSYFVTVRAYSSFSGLTLTGSFENDTPHNPDEPDHPVPPPGDSEYGLVNACDAGRPTVSNQNLNLEEAYCTQSVSSSGQERHFRYTPTSSDVGRDILFTIGHGDGVAGLTANQDFGDFASESDYEANKDTVVGSFGLDPTDRRLTYNRVIVTNVQSGKDILLNVIGGSGGFNGVAVKGEVVIPVDSSMPDACAQGKPEITDEYVTLGEVNCGLKSIGRGHYTHFVYRPTEAEAGKTFILEMAHGTGHGGMTVNQHYSSSPNSDGTAFAHEEHLADRPDLVYSSFNAGVEQRVVYPNATAGTDILVVIPPGPDGFSKFTFRIRAED